MDFFSVKTRVKRGDKGVLEVYPDFQNDTLEDLLVRGGKFYAVWNEKKGLWSQKPMTARRLVDEELWSRAKEVEAVFNGSVSVLDMKSESSGSWNRFIQYLKRFPDCDVQLDNKLAFQNTKVEKKDYISKRLNYSLESGDYSAWDKLVSTLYDPLEKEKIEWAIGAIVSGDSKTIQKFCVFYGEPGSGKGTIIEIIRKLFEGYYTVFDARALGSSSDQFSTEVFASNPLVAIQTDGNLSRIEDNTKLNTIISHEPIVINEKNKSRYMARINCFMFLGTNSPVKITDARSGIIRRLIDISPSGRLLPSNEYDALMSQIDFQLGAIAYHCLNVYRNLGKNYYKNYKPRQMIMKTDVFYNFVYANEDMLNDEQGISLKQAYALYKQYCDEALVEFKLPMYKFREELKAYFENFDEVTRIDGKQFRSWYSGFKLEKMEAPVLKKEPKPLPMALEETKSLLDDVLKDCKAQYANDKEKPIYIWSEVTTTLKDIDTTKLHYILPKNPEWPYHLIMIDLDIRNENGEKDMLLNLEAASKFPPTYAEFSKGGGGIHLIYWYDGSVDKLQSVYAPGIEIKTFRGNSSMRRRLSKCNNIPITVISSGLPLKEEKMIDVKAIKSQKKLVEVIRDCLNKKHHGHTKPEIDFIVKILDDAYASGLVYDVSDLEHDIRVFAMHSSNNAEYCKKQIRKMKFKSEQEIEEVAVTKKTDNDSLVFFDIEVFPNLLLVNYKFEGKDNPVVRLINPSPHDIEELFKYKLVGFNCRKYDNHILYGRYLGLSVEELYDLSQRIIVEQARSAFYPEAYNVSYTDVYDFSSKKQSLKKFEIELGIHHQELGLPWDKPVPEEMWEKVAEYCDNDVIATEAVFENRKADFTARQILAAVAGLTVNDTTNTLTTRIIFGGERKPQSQFNYRDMGDISDAVEGLPFGSALDDDSLLDYKYTVFDSKRRPIFPGYEFKFGKSTYRGEEVGEGGYVYAEPGVHRNVALLDIASMHPSSIVAEELFGPLYTQRFHDILNARIAIKHGDFDTARTLLDGKLAPFLEDESAAKDLAQALKIAINSVYGLTSARFENPFRDKRNLDNIVAKRGALFMVNLKHEVQNRGFTVAHIKTDSIKIPNATLDIIEFVMEYGKLYGYNFEHEATYDRMCLVNDAVYIAKYLDAKSCETEYHYIPEKNQKHGNEWSATGAQFQQPYVFKTLFSGEPIEFSDYCESKNVTGGAIYLDLNEKLPDVSDYEAQLEKLCKKYKITVEDIKAFADDRSMPESDVDGIGNALETAIGLMSIIETGHNYNFVGRAGLFCPVKSGYDGGIMYREKNGKYYAISGTKGYRWLEAETVQALNIEDCVDPTYHESLVTDAIDTIEKYEDYNSFAEGPNVDVLDDGKPPFDIVPCGDNKYTNCLECPNCSGDICRRGYSLNSYIENGSSLKDEYDDLPF